MFSFKYRLTVKKGLNLAVCYVYMTKQPYYEVNKYHNNRSFFFTVLDNCIISSTIQENKLWEPHMHRLFEKYVTKDSIVVECGAHIGTHTLKLALLANHVYAFEPMPSTNKVLHRNLLLNTTGNVTIFQEGVSDASGSTTFRWIPFGNPGASCLDNNPMVLPSNLPSVETIHVPLRTIDSLNLDRLDFMKIDVEGYESLVIKGAMNTIRKHRPVIVMEVWSNLHTDTSIEHTRYKYRELLSLGYNVSHVEGPDYLFTPM